MAIEDITTKIIDDARRDAEDIARTTKVEVDEIAQNAQNEMDAIVKDLEQKLEQTLARRAQTSSSRARRNARTLVDTMRRKLIDDVFAEAQQTIVQLDDVTYQKFVERLLRTVPQQDLAQAVRVRVPAQRKGIAQKLLAHKSGNAEIVTDDTIDAGMVVELPHVAYDLTLARMMKDSVRDLEASVAKVLFA